MKNETDALNKAFIELQEKHIKELELLKDHFHTTYESLKPDNQSNDAQKEDAPTSDILGNILGIVIGIGSGFLVKKLLVGNSQNPIRRLFGTMIQFAIANEVSKHNDMIKHKVETFLHRIFDQNEEAH